MSAFGENVRNGTAGNGSQWVAISVDDGNKTSPIKMNNTLGMPFLISPCFQSNLLNL